MCQQGLPARAHRCTQVLLLLLLHSYFTSQHTCTRAGKVHRKRSVATMPHLMDTSVPFTSCTRSEGNAGGCALRTIQACGSGGKAEQCRAVRSAGLPSPVGYLGMGGERNPSGARTWPQVLSALGLLSCPSRALSSL